MAWPILIVCRPIQVERMNDRQPTWARERQIAHHGSFCGWAEDADDYHGPLLRIPTKPRQSDRLYRDNAGLCSSADAPVPQLYTEYPHIAVFSGKFGVKRNRISNAKSARGVEVAPLSVTMFQQARFRVCHLQRFAVSVYSQGTAQLFVSKRARAETESDPTRRFLLPAFGFCFHRGEKVFDLEDMTVGRIFVHVFAQDRLRLVELVAAAVDLSSQDF